MVSAWVWTSTHLKLQHGSLSNLNGGEEAELIFPKLATMFLNGCLHYIGFCEGYRCILAVDMEGKAWKKIPNRPHGFPCSIHQAHGHLCQCTVGGRNMSKLSI